MTIIDAPPADVYVFLQENYTPEGARMWLAAWERGNAEKRERMLAAARSDGNAS